jgi:hypothetical protein
VTADNKALAARARELADQYPGGSLERRASACAAVALDASRTITGARKVLNEDLGDIEVRVAALEAVEAVTEAPEAEPQ